MQPTDEQMKELISTLKAITAVNIARKCNSGDVDIYKDYTNQEIQDLISTMGVSETDPIDVHIDKIDEKINSIRHCLESKDMYSALILCSVFIESQINETIRACMRVRNFSHGCITDTIKGVNLKVKINTLMPLLEIDISERQRQIALEQIAIRNEAIHGKGVPELWHDNGSRVSSESIVKGKIKEYFEEYTFEEIIYEFRHFFDSSIIKQPHVQRAYDLLNSISA